jgi:hypothetical protein
MKKKEQKLWKKAWKEAGVFTSGQVAGTDYTTLPETKKQERKFFKTLKTAGQYEMGMNILGMPVYSQPINIPKTKKEKKIYKKILGVNLR